MNPFAKITPDLFAEYLKKHLVDENGRTCDHSSIEVQADGESLMLFAIYGGEAHPKRRAILDNNRRIPVFTFICPQCGWMNFFSAQHVLDTLIADGRIDSSAEPESDNHE